MVLEGPPFFFPQGAMVCAGSPVALDRGLTRGVRSGRVPLGAGSPEHPVAGAPGERTSGRRNALVIHRARGRLGGVELIAETEDGRVLLVAEVGGMLVDRASGAVLDPARVVLRGVDLERRPRPARVSVPA